MPASYPCRLHVSFAACAALPASKRAWAAAPLLCTGARRALLQQVHVELQRCAAAAHHGVEGKQAGSCVAGRSPGPGLGLPLPLPARVGELWAAAGTAMAAWKDAISCAAVGLPGAAAGRGALLAPEAVRDRPLWRAEGCSCLAPARGPGGA
jgi:hypothetical protein